MKLVSRSKSPMPTNRAGTFRNPAGSASCEMCSAVFLAPAGAAGRWNCVACTFSNDAGSLRVFSDSNLTASRACAMCGGLPSGGDLADAYVGRDLTCPLCFV